MKRLIVLLLLIASPVFALANQVGYRFGDVPELDPQLPNIVSGEGVYFSISGSAQGSEAGYLTLTYSFFQPLREVEFGFILRGASIIRARVTASYYEEDDKTISDENVHYFWGGAEDGDVRQISLYVPDYEGGDPADDFLEIVSIRIVENDGTQVPEPGTIALLSIAALGMCGAGCIRRRA